MIYQKTSFIFVGHSWSPTDGKATFSYQVQHADKSYDFSENLIFPLSKETSSISPKLLRDALDSLLLVLGISYYKLFCPEHIDLGNIKLSKKQAEFWTTLYTKGLGEFYYKNKIDFRGLVNFPISKVDLSSTSYPRQNRSLLGIGGGKDSIVAGELLKKNDKKFTGFVVKPHQIMEQSIQLLGIGSIIIKRKIDPLLFELNKRVDTYNGHVPISSQTAFISIFTAILLDYKYIVMANEQSANFGNTKYLDQEVNHQWSKSFEFEKLFQNYVKEFITPDVFYFSLLRPFSELKIAKIFSNYPKYFSSFSSCNKNFKINGSAKAQKWCGTCPKCAFVFAILSPFLEKKELVTIFGKNLFSETKLLETYKELLGVSKQKPFDCVGTPDEVKVAFYLASLNEEYKTDLIMEFFENEIFPNISDIKKLEEDVFKNSDQHSIPQEFEEILSPLDMKLSNGLNI